MLTRHARTRAPFSRYALFSTTSRIAKKSEGTRPSWLETKGRTQSFLFDENNPVINKEAYALHKVHLSKISTDADPRLKSVLDQEDVRSWQSNPYRERMQVSQCKSISNSPFPCSLNARFAYQKMPVERESHAEGFVRSFSLICERD